MSKEMQRSGIGISRGALALAVIGFSGISWPGAGISTPCWAGDLKAPFDIESTAVLPKGVRNPRFKNIITYMDEKFGGNGAAEELGYKLNKNISWRDVADGADDQAKRDALIGKLRQVFGSNYSLDSSAGNSSGVVNTYANVKVPVLAMGVTENLTMAIAVPIVHVEVNADTGLIASQDAKTLLADAQKTDPVLANDSAVKLNDAVNSKLRRLGYDPIKDDTINNIGDVKLVGKYKLFQRGRFSMSVKGEATLPTGTHPNPDKALDVPTGDGQMDLGVGILADQYLDSQRAWRINGYATYTAQLPDDMEKRLPVSDRDSLSRDKEMLARDLGDVIATGAAIQYEFPFGVQLSTGANYQFMTKTTYGDGQFESYRYRLLEANTSQMLASATFGVGFSTVEMFKRKEFKAPLQINWTYNMPLAGINTVKNDLMAFEVVLFF